MKLITWNVAHRLRILELQWQWIFSQRPDVFALQEVTPNIAAKLDRFCKNNGYANTQYSIPDSALVSGNRAYGVFIGSRWQMLPLQSPALEWGERAIACRITMPSGYRFSMISTYIPPGSSNGWRKIETIEGIVRHVLQEDIDFLCGDFNCPQLETSSGEIVTWAQAIRTDGTFRLKKKHRGGDGVRWDAAERSLFTELREAGLRDCFRTANGYGANEGSYFIHRGDKTISRRFDHAFSRLDCVDAYYDHHPRIDKLSDHSPLVVNLA